MQMVKSINIFIQVETMEKKKERLLTIKFNADTAAQMRCKRFFAVESVCELIPDQNLPHSSTGGISDHSSQW